MKAYKGFNKDLTCRGFQYEENESDYGIKEWKAVEVDGEKIKADTWYQLVNGELIECE